MKLMIVVLSILFERYVDMPHPVRCFAWFETWSRWVETRLGKEQHPALVLAGIILPVLFGLHLMLWLFGWLIWGSVGFTLELCLFYFCLGPNTVFHEQFSDQLQTAERYFSRMNRECFGLIFWYLALGILGAVGYRLIERAALKLQPNQAAQKILPYLDWIPARLTAFLYVLVGNFQRVIPYWLTHAWSSPEKNELFLVQCGMLSLEQEGKQVTLSLAKQLVWYALILLLVCMALLTLARWL